MKRSALTAPIRIALTALTAPLTRTAWIALAAVAAIAAPAAVFAATVPVATVPAARMAAASTETTGLQALLSETQSAGQSDSQFLPPDRAFRVGATADGPDHVRVDWTIAAGYYLYRDRIRFASGAPGLRLGAASLPAGQIKHDPYFGQQVIYHLELIATLPVVRSGDAGGERTLPLSVTYQGCAEAGLCYPPVTRVLDVSLPPPATGGDSAADAHKAALGSTGAGATAAATGSPPTTGAFESEQSRLADLIRGGNILAVLGTFFGLGLLLAFTPCVLPMVPILSGLIAGHSQPLTTWRAGTLSLTYVLGMALTYTVAGAAFAAAGHPVQAAFQQGWVIVLFAALFIGLAASMFGLFPLQVPSFLMTHLTVASNRQRGGSYGGVAVMGALSALIVTTCVAPPLVATLAVIGQSGDIARGAAALFAMSLGMGTPLLVVGTSAGRLLPRAGAWMEGIKRLFGVMMLAVAAWMLARIVPPSVVLVLYAIPAAAAALVLWTLDAPGAVRLATRVPAVAAAAYAALLLAGAGAGHADPLAPLASPDAVQALHFQPVGSVAQLQREVAAAAARHQPVMLDFYADWCSSCKEMEHDTFSQPGVQQLLRPVRLLRADVTANTPADRQLLQRFQIYGPPTIAFYNAQGVEQPGYRVVGFMKPAPFATLLRQAFAATG